MKPRSELYYEGRIAIGGALLLPLLAFPSYAIFCAYNWRQDPPVQELITREIFMGFELLMPLTAALAIAHLITLEQEAHFAAIRDTYPERSGRLPFLRLGEAMAVTAVGTLFAAGVFALWGVPYSLVSALLPAVPPTLWLMSVTLRGYLPCFCARGQDTGSTMC